MDITQQPYKHLKLDKFVYGSKQKIIKTTTQVLNRDEDELINYQGNKKNVYYFSDIDNYLIDFHQINFDYINNKKGKITVNSYIDRYNPSFSISANIIKHYTTEQDGQRIAYFPQYIYTPLDIAQFKNSCYFLLPISTNKFINIAHPNKILNDVQKFKYSPIPSHISSYITPHNSFFDRAAYTSEDNSIPVYDMNFKEMETIKFNSATDLYNWILKWGLQSIIYQDQNGDYHSLINEILFDSTKGLTFTELLANDLSIDDCDSIKLEPFINYLIQKRYLYSRETFNSMLSELFANLSNNSMERYFKLVGKINELNTAIKTTSGSVYKTISGELVNQGVYNVYDLINKKQEVTFTPNVLPQNTLLIDNMGDRVVYDTQKPIREYFPSCYVNFVNLKNSRDPQYQLNCTIGDIKVQNDIFLNDYRFSINANNYFNSSKPAYLSTMNKQRTTQIVNKAIEYDNNLASNTGYNNLFPQRMNVKRQHYLNQYNDNHIVNNTLSSMGTLNGIRNYIHVGNSFSKKVWLSYSYSEEVDTNIFETVVNSSYINDNSLNALPSRNYSLPFYSYSLNRDAHWTKDYNGNNKTTCIMKSYGIECPWGSEIQSGIIGCQLGLQKQCSGFCTFPCNGQIKQSFNDNRGLNWNLRQYYNLHKGLEDVRLKMNNGLRLTNNQEWFIIPSSEFDQLIIADSDIVVSDDLEIFFTSSSLDSNAQFSDIVSNITLKQELKSLFQGFWNDGKYSQFRYTDSNGYSIAPNSKFNGPHIITKDSIITGIILDNNSTSSNVIPAGHYCLMRVKSWWSDTIRCEGSIKIVQNNSSVLSTSINNYDFVQNVDGFFKFKQTGLHKSNIYSINLKNTGLSKAQDKETKMYTKQEVIRLLQQKYFIKYYQDEDSFLVNSDENTFIHAIFDSTDNTTYKRTPLFKESMSGFVLNYITIPFETLVQYDGLKSLLNEQFIQLYYYQKEYNEAVEYNSVRQNIRQLIQKAIRKSITRYMPADTNLWKVEYEDED